MARDRPKSWNDDVRWLLERVAGLRPEDGAGTPADGLPLGIATNEVLHYITDTHTAIDSNGEITLQMPTTSRIWSLVAFSYNRIAGTGNRITVRVGQEQGFADDSAGERVALDRQSVSDKVNVVFQQPVPFYVDSNYRAYLHPGYNSGNDNTGTYLFFFIQGIATSESP